MNTIQLKLAFELTSPPASRFAIPFALPVSALYVSDRDAVAGTAEPEKVTFGAEADVEADVAVFMDAGSSVRTLFAVTALDDKLSVALALEAELDAQLQRIGDACWAGPGMSVDLHGGGDPGPLEMTVWMFDSNVTH